MQVDHQLASSVKYRTTFSGMDLWFIMTLAMTGNRLIAN